MTQRQPPLSQELRDRDWLHKLCITHQECFAALSPFPEQRALHDYYKAHRQDWSKEQARDHIAGAPADLAEQAHIALLTLKGVLRWCERTQGRSKVRYRLPPSPSSSTHQTASGRTIRVSALAKPELDVDLFVKALIDLARKIQNEEDPTAS